MNNFNICLPLCIHALTPTPHLRRRPGFQSVAGITETLECELEPKTCKRDSKTIIKGNTNLHTYWCTQDVLLPVTTQLCPTSKKGNVMMAVIRRKRRAEAVQ